LATKFDNLLTYADIRQDDEKVEKAPLKLMKIQTKLIILISIIIIIFAGGLVFTNQLEKKKIASILQNRAREKKALLDLVAMLNGNSIKNLAYDYTYWDEMVDFVKNPSPQWAADNLETSLSTYNVNAIWIFKPVDYSKVYSINNINDTALSEFLLPYDTLREIFSHDKFCHFFVKSSAGPIEVRGAPIQPSSDVERSTLPQGYFIAGRLWNDGYLKELSLLTESDIKICTPGAQPQFDSNYSPVDGSIYFSLILSGWDNKPIIEIQAVNQSEMISEAQNSAENNFWLFVIYIFIILTILIVALIKWVNTPLNLISRSLNSGDSSELKELEKDNSEFGHLAQLIRTFFEQNSDLIKEVIERTEAEKALRESENYFKALFDTAPAGMIVIDAKEHKIVDVNQYALEKIGRNKEALIGQECRGLLCKGDKGYCQPKVKKLRTEYSEELLNCANGTSLVIIKSVIPVMRHGREYLIESFIDISELKKYEQELQDSATKLAILADEQKILLENTRDFIYRRDGNGEYYYISPSIERITGYTVEEWQNNYSSYLTDSESNIRGRKHLKSVPISGQDDPIYLVEILHKDGRIIQLEFNEQAYSLNGAVAGVIGVARDVTERHIIDERLRQSEERYRYLIENITDGVIISDFESGNIIYANNTACAIAGYDLPEMIGINIFDLVTEDNLAKLKDEIQKRQAGQEGHYELFITRKDKQRRCINMTAKPYYDNLGVLRGAFAVLSDITDIKQAEEDKQQLQDKLERAQRMESLGVLAGGVAHDLNNILGPLVAYPELVLMKLPVDSPVRKQIEIMGRSAREAADVIADLLSLARRGRYEMAPTHLNKVIEEFIESPSFYGLTTRNASIDMVMNLDRSIDPIMGSSSHLMKVIMNLIYNSFDAMPEGGELTITTTQKNINKLEGGYDKIVKGEYLLISVRDAGMGIDPKEISKIFEPYYTKKKMNARSGSGLGLSVVYGIIKDHKGYYDIISELGKGTEFILYFPIIKVDKTVVSDNIGDYKGTEQVLVVDDIEEQREVVSQILLSLGYRVETASSGHEAVARLKENKYDIIILDMILDKDYDGYDTYKEIANSYPKQKAILISGYSVTERVEMAQVLGAGKFVKKPFSRDAIAQAVREELDRNDIDTSRSILSPSVK
jgi:PAS domain S-box-containing protein